jgi:alpha-glucosidase
MLGAAFQLTFPGSPAVYYGDEIGLEGGDDPDNRRCFPWERTQWNADVLNDVKRLIALRKKESALRTGSIHRFHVEGRFLVFERVDASARFLVAINAEPAASRRFALPHGTWDDALRRETAAGDQEIPAQSYAIYRNVSR